MDPSSTMPTPNQNKKKNKRAGNCCIKDCKSTSDGYIRIHPFPKNEDHRNKWVRVISRSDPEFAKKDDSELSQLGVCDDHFMFDYYDDVGLRKRRHMFPNKITQQEVKDGVPIVSSDPERKMLKRKKHSAPALQKMDSESDVRWKNPKIIEQSTLVQQRTDSESVVRRKKPKIYKQSALVQQETDSVRRKKPKIIKQSILVQQETVIKVEYEEVCRLCLATDVKMFSLKSEPLKQYFEFIKPCIDEWDVLPSENFPTTVCYLCANSLKTCYEFGKICSQSQTVFTEFYLIYSKINTLAIKNYDKGKLKFHRNLGKFSPPVVYIDPEDDLRFQDSDKPKRKKIPNIPKVEVKKEVVFDVNEFGFEDLETPEVTHEVLITPEVLIPPDDNNVMRKVNNDNLHKNETVKVEIDIAQPSTSNVKSIDNPWVIPPQATMLMPSHYNYVDHSVFGSLGFDGDMASEQMPSQLVTTIISETGCHQNEATPKTKSIDKPTNVEQTTQSSNSVTKKGTASTDNDNVSFVDDTNVTQKANVTQDSEKDTPILSESTIYTLKRSVYKTHGEVDVERMFYQGGDIMVVMVNAEGKHVQLKLSRKAGLQPPPPPPPQVQTKLVPPMDVRFRIKCWNVKTLTKDQQTLIMQQRKSSPRYQKAQYKCTACFKSFTRRDRYISHTQKHNPRSGRFVCEICKLYFKEESQAQYHERLHTFVYSCKICEETFYSKYPAAEHQLQHTNYQCRLCEKQFKMQSNFESHMLNHAKEVPKDSVPTVELLKPIIKYDVDIKAEVVERPKKPEKQKWSMNCCETKFTVRTLFQKHYRDVHPGEECPLNERCVCDTCGKVFNLKKSLSAHLETHRAPSERQFLCQYCPAILCSQRGLTLHQALHSEVRFQCPNCPKQYKMKHVLKRHLRYKCGKNLEEVPRPFSCDVCGKSFIEKATLQAHVLALHLGVKQPKQKEWKHLNKVTKREY